MEPYTVVGYVGHPGQGHVQVVLYACLACGALVPEIPDARNPREYKSQHDAWHVSQLQVTP